MTPLQSIGKSEETLKPNAKGEHKNFNNGTSFFIMQFTVELIVAIKA
jgi:hypothetical protein